MTNDNIEAQVTEDGILLAARDHADDFRAAGTAAVLMAENIEGRYGEEADLARMLRTANAFAQDVARDAVLFENEVDAGEADPDDEGPQPSSGQFIDLLLLGMAAGWHARTLERSHNKGPDPEKYHSAAETMVDAWDSLFRQMGLSAIGGKLDRIEYRYGVGFREDERRRGGER